jgi:hypothetical protein
MTYLTQAFSPQLNLTTSTLQDDWLNFLDENGSIIKIIKKMQIIFPKLSKGKEELSWKLYSIDTTKNESTITYPGLDIIYEISSPAMPPLEQFTINIIVDEIEEGLPSICDEIELEL